MLDHKPKYSKFKGRVMQLKTQDGLTFCVHENGDQHIFKSEDENKHILETHNLAKPFQPGPLPNGFILYYCKDPKSLMVTKGEIPKWEDNPGITVPYDTILNIPELLGVPIKPLTWYHLILEWDKQGKYQFIFVINLKTHKPKMPFSRRLGTIHTTTKRTVRKFHQNSTSFVWTNPTNKGLDAGKLTTPSGIYKITDKIWEPLTPP